MAVLRPIPHPSVPLVDAAGRMTNDWYLYFQTRERAGVSNLSDVSATAPTNGQVLTWNTTTLKWTPAAN